MVKSHLHFNKNPWKETIISGFVTLEGKKMSKSKGNIVRPQEVIEKYGADAVRYWAASSKLGEDFDYQEKDVVTGAKFVTKILNATRFAFMKLKHQAKAPTLIEADRLLLNQLNSVIKNATEAFENYDYAKAKMEADSFFWKTFADNYLEIIKNRVYNGTDDEKASAFYTLYHSLLTILKLMAPITPFITEEIYHEHFKKYEGKDSIHQEDWPSTIKVKSEKSDEQAWTLLLDTITKVRQAKSQAKKAMNSPIILTLPKDTQASLRLLLADLKSVTAAQELREGNFEVIFV
jgi:valyl-tRNA synthetase